MPGIRSRILTIKEGESLDWSSPGLLERLGTGADRLLADQIAVDL